MVEAGVATIKVTREVGTPLEGHPRDVPSTGVRDELELGVLLVEEGPTRVALADSRGRSPACPRGGRAHR